MNVTASTLLDLTLPDRIAELCTQHKVPPEKLILEVTETEAMRDVTRTMDVLLRMRIRNIGVSIDDFGTGHSSLRELQRMPFSEMKIDKLRHRYGPEQGLRRDRQRSSILHIISALKSSPKASRMWSWNAARQALRFCARLLYGQTNARECIRRMA